MRNLVLASLLVLTLWNFKSTLGAETVELIFPKPCNECQGEVICEGSCECVGINVDGSLTTYKCLPEKQNLKVCVDTIELDDNLPYELKSATIPTTGEPFTEEPVALVPANIEFKIVKYCPKCPAGCQGKSVISSLPSSQNYHGRILGPGLCLKDEFEVKNEVKNDCNILTIKRKGNKKFCIHDLNLTIGGRDCYDYTLSIKGKKKVTNWCPGPSGSIMIPSDSPLYNGQKTKKLVIKVCKSNCKVLSWILSACVETVRIIFPD